MDDITAIDWLGLAPELALLTTALLVLLVELFLHGERKRLVNPLAAAGTAVSLGFVIALAVDGATRSSFGAMHVVDNYALLFKAFFLGTLLFVLLVSYRYFTEIRTYQGEYYFLLLSAFLGMMLMASARDLVMIFIALELISVPGFVMAALRKFDLRSNEGALKFFLIGVLSVAVLLFGLSVIYGYTGTTDLAGTAEALADAPRDPLLLASILFVIVGFGFKISAVPFHFWAPDTYAGAPMPVAAMLAVASKAAGFAGLISVAFIAFEPVADVWAPVLGVLAILTMTLGNLIALQQRDLIRLLAYSSVAQAGYILLPFGLAAPGNAVVNDAAVQAVLFYLIAYAVMNIGAFGVAIAVNRRTGLRSIADYAGLASRSPLLAMAMTVFLLSLGGAPATVGLWAKFAILEAVAVEITVFGVVLASFLVINSVIAFFYYLKVVRTIWMDEARVGLPALQPGLNLSVVVAVLMLVTVVLGVLPGLVTDFSSVTSLVAAG
jgi:NADH-quinone oxidoreductase subunit N